MTPAGGTHYQSPLQDPQRTPPKKPCGGYPQKSPSKGPHKGLCEGPPRRVPIKEPPKAPREEAPLKDSLIKVSKAKLGGTFGRLMLFNTVTYQGKLDSNHAKAQNTQEDWGLGGGGGGDTGQ